MENKVTADYLDEEGCLHCGTCGASRGAVFPAAFLPVQAWL